MRSSDFLGCLFVFFTCVCNPVPNPGNQTNSPAKFADSVMRQTLLLDYAIPKTGLIQGEGCHGSTTVTEATTWEHAFIHHFANSGNPLPMGSGPKLKVHKVSQVQKRSYFRACRRAMQLGAAWYKGRILTSQDFPSSLCERVTHKSASTGPIGMARQLPSRAARIRLLTWNPGGMAQGKLVELRQWLQTNPYDIVVIPETKWGFHRCWQDDTWSYIHSCTGTPRVGGILIMVARSLLKAAHIGFHEVMPGRILHTRLHFANKSLDVLAVYQFADDGTQPRLQQREVFWDTLDTYLFQMPARNQLVCCGDYNCALKGAPPWVGTNTFKWQGHQHTGKHHRDMERFQELLRRHALTAANTWTSSTGPSFFHGDYAARIDFFLLRIQMCDGIAKQSHYLNNASFLPLNQTHHFPLECTIRTQHAQFHQTKYKPACNFRQRAQCRDDSMQETANWLQLSHLVAETCQQMDQLEIKASNCIQDLHTAIIPPFQQMFTGKYRHPVSTIGAVSQVIQNKWGHRRAIRILSHQQGCSQLFTCMQVWFHWSRFRILQRQQQRQIRQARTARFNALCQDATVAANKHDAHSLFQIINRYSPKRPMLRARLKTHDGKIADQYTAHQLTVDHIISTWQGADLLKPPVDVIPGVPISVQDIEQAILQLHPHKAVAAPFLPAVVWKSAPRELAHFIHHCLTRWWSRSPPVVPVEWRDAWLFFLPKPGKPGTHPSHLRPISLMEPIGKMVLGLLTAQLQACHVNHLCSHPHFGFLPKRDALDAIARVASHCNRIRSLVGNQKRTVARQMANAPRYTLCGGLQMFLDLKHAFDSVNRAALFEHLVHLGTPENLLQLISTWHTDTHYNLIFNGKTTQIPVNVGLRQGCKAAPLLWVLFMDRFLQLLSTKVDATWITEAITLYADDIHVGTVFYSSAQYHDCLHKLGCVLDAVEELQLILSYEKTYIIMATAGTSIQRGLKGTISRTKQGMAIQIPRASGQCSQIPLRAKGKYLGTELSYGQYELQTWHQRLKAARSAFSRLRCWFKNKQFLTTHRIYLWKVCVHTILTYGICATNLTVKILIEYQQTIYQMMRTVLHDHSYHSHRTHQQVFAQFGLDPPLRMLASHVERTWHRLQRRALALTATDFLHQVDWTHLPELLKLIHCVADSTVDPPIAMDATAPVRSQVIHRCHACTFETDSVPNFRRHLTVYHASSQYRTSAVAPLTMAKMGTPQCRNCHAAFTSWRRFFIHVERNCCQVETHGHRPAVPDASLDSACRDMPSTVQRV